MQHLYRLSARLWAQAPAAHPQWPDPDQPGAMGEPAQGPAGRTSTSQVRRLATRLRRGERTALSTLPYTSIALSIAAYGVCARSSNHPELFRFLTFFSFFSVFSLIWDLLSFFNIFIFKLISFIIPFVYFFFFFLFLH
jgi:hypothetical protein